MLVRSTPSPVRRKSLGLTRLVLIGGVIILFHVLALWGLQTGLLRRAVAVFVPVVVVSEVVQPALPEVPPPPRVPPPSTVTKQVAKSKTSTPQPAPQLRPVPNPDPAPNAPVAAPTPPGPLPPIAAPVMASETPGAGPPLPSAGPSVELPSSDAQYLQNPKPTYPPTSRRLGEQGTVLVQVLIGADGNAHKAEIKKSSGFFRLDQAALATVLKWRYVPGKRAGVAEAMWFTVPIAFALE